MKTLIMIVSTYMGNFSFADIEAAETVRWLRDQLLRLSDFVENHGGDDAMLEALSHLMEEKDQSLNFDTSRRLERGLLAPSQTSRTRH